MEAVRDDCLRTWVKGMMQSGMTGMEVKLKATMGRVAFSFSGAQFFKIAHFHISGSREW